jgi:hypothetical protein
MRANKMNFIFNDESISKIEKEARERKFGPETKKQEIERMVKELNERCERLKSWKWGD